MIDKRRRRQPKPSADADAGEIESLYQELLRAFYQAGDRRRARSVAKLLEKALASHSEWNGSIRFHEIQSLMAELRGDWREAIEHRHVEIRRILELHCLTRTTPSWEFVERQYGANDVSDRLDLLAILYDNAGDLERAIETLHESRQYCEAQQISFDGQDLLDEFEAMQKKTTNGSSAAAAKRLADSNRARYRKAKSGGARITR